jgi:hypothetical protein
MKKYKGEIVQGKSNEGQKVISQWTAVMSFSSQQALHPLTRTSEQLSSALRTDDGYLTRWLDTELVAARVRYG